MDVSTARDIDESRQNEQDLARRLKTGNTIYTYLDVPLEHIRKACCKALTQDYRAANAQNAEDRLWDSHQKANTHYRAALAKLKKASDKRIVEQRKLGAEYLKFIKGSQKFYRAFIGKLATAYGSIPALERVANRLGNPEKGQPSAKVAARPDPAELEQCCHRTLIRLGDLSRYREQELPDKDRGVDWAHAIGYYDLAHTICPGSGQPFNQRAVISIAGRHLFRATYYAYRSLTAETPHPSADDNLQRVMGMVSKAWDKGELTAESNTTEGAALPGPVTAGFLRISEQHSRGNAGDATAELEEQALIELETNLSNEPRQATPVKLVLISIAAQHAAQARLLQQPDNIKLRSAYISFLALNMRMSETMFKVLQKGVKEAGLKQRTSETANGAASNTIDDIPPVIRRVLPAIRLYGTWLSRSSTLLNSSIIEDDLKSSFWSTLADCLSALASAYPANKLPELEHLLEEDEDTLGFVPLWSVETNNLWYSQGVQRPKWQELSDNDREVGKEMLFRIKGLLVVGLTLAVESEAPLQLDQETLIFKHAQNAAKASAPQTRRFVARRVPSTSRPTMSSPHPTNLAQPHTPARPLHSPKAALQDDELEAERMVESIVGASEESPAETEQPTPKASRSGGSPQRCAPRTGSFGTTSPVLNGSKNVMDIMAQAFRAGTARSGSVSRNASALQSPAMPKTLPRHHSGSSERSNGRTDLREIWESAETNGCLSGLGQWPANAAMSPTLAGRSSPLPAPRAHSRGGSQGLIPSVWSPSPSENGGWPSKPRPEAPSMIRTASSRNLSNLGNGTFGHESPGANDQHHLGLDCGWNGPLANPTVQSPWSPEYRNQKRLSAGSPLGPTSAQLPPSYSHESPLQMRLGSDATFPRAFRPSNLQQHTTAHGKG